MREIKERKWGKDGGREREEMRERERGERE